MKYRITLIIAVMLLFGLKGFSADNPKTISLNECVTIALQNNPAVFVSTEDKKKALAEYRVANAQRNVFINAEVKSSQYPKTTEYALWEQFLPFPWNYINAKYRRKANQTSGLSKYYNIGLSVGVVAGISLYNEKKNRLVESARSGMKLADMQSRKVMNDLIYNVKKAYYSHLMAKDTVALREKLLKYNEERLKVTQLLYKNAQKAIYDLSKAQVDLSDAQLELQKAKNIERSTRMELLRAMGIDDPGRDFILESYDAMPGLQYSVDELYKLGELNYPDMQIAKLQKDISRIKIAVERADHYPQVELQAGAGYENGGLNFNNDDFKSDNWRPTFAFGFTARLPLFSGGMVKAKTDSAQSEYNKTVYREKDVYMNMLLIIENHYVTLQELSNQIATSKLVLGNADKHFKLARRMYESGATTMLDLNDANVTRVNAEVGYLKTKYDYLVTLAKLSSIVGLGEDSLCKK